MDRRSRLVAAVRRSIERSSFPRWQLGGILAATGIFALLASLALLALGLDHMGWRYALVFAAAYALFLALLRWWASSHQHDDLFDPTDVLPVDLNGGGSGGAADAVEGGGGGFGGGGASGGWSDEPSGVGGGVAPSGVDGGVGEAAASEAGGGAAEAASGLVPDLDEGGLLLLPLVVLGAGLVAIAFVIWGAPLLLAELVLEVAILGGAYRRLRRVEAQGWLWSALRRTWAAALVVGVMVTGLGFALEIAAPEARTIGEALASSGVGTSIVPVRFLVPPEVSVLTLESAAAR